jgi:hypothetical protein
MIGVSAIEMRELNQGSILKIHGAVQESKATPRDYT